MTAIGGYWGHEGQDAAERCARILKSQAIYGPHHAAQRTDGAIALGRRLFRTLPEDRHDTGPVTGGDGTLTLVADVRIDNRSELARSLDLPAGQVSDAAMLMAALERWDEAALDRIVGDFAFALWDARRARLLLARDFLGQRPLHYHRGDGFFAFASMPKGLHALSEIPYAPHEQTAADFLALMPETGSESFFEGIERVPPGHSLSVDRNGVSLRRYWNPLRAPLRLRAAADYEEAMREQMDAAVSSRLRGSDGSVAAHLSAGLDSATVATTAARLLAPDGKVVAFTSVPKEGYPAPLGRLADEGPLARETARLHPNIEHIEVQAGGRSLVDTLDRNFFLYDRPLLNLCNMSWADAICDQARERRLGILLTGQMGNMSFSYNGMEALPGLFGQRRFTRLARMMLALKRNGHSWKSLLAATVGPYLPPAVWQRLLVLADRSPQTIDRYSAIRMAAVAEFDVRDRARECGLEVT